MTNYEYYCPRLGKNVRAAIMLSSGKELFDGMICAYFYQFACTQKRPDEGSSCDLVERARAAVEHAQSSPSGKDSFIAAAEISGRQISQRGRYNPKIR